MTDFQVLYQKSDVKEFRAYVLRISRSSCGKIRCAQCLLTTKHCFAGDSITEFFQSMKCFNLT